MSHTRLSAKYWRYLIKCKGRRYTVQKFHTVLKKAEEGKRRDELINIYLEVFRATANR